MGFFLLLFYWRARLTSSTLVLKQKKTHTHRATCPHTYTHAVICCQCYEAHAEFTHRRRGQDFHHKIIREAIVNHSLLSLSSLQPPIKILTECRSASFTGQNLAHPSAQFHHRFDITLMQLRTSHRCPTPPIGSGCESVSQLHTASYVTMLFKCVRPYHLFSRQVSFCGRCKAFFFLLYSHYWSFQWVISHWLKYILYLIRPKELFHCKCRVWAHLRTYMHARLPGTLC